MPRPISQHGEGNSFFSIGVDAVVARGGECGGWQEAREVRQNLRVVDAAAGHDKISGASEAEGRGSPDCGGRDGSCSEDGGRGDQDRVVM